MATVNEAVRTSSCWNLCCVSVDKDKRTFKNMLKAFW